MGIVTLQERRDWREAFPVWAVLLSPIAMLGGVTQIATTRRAYTTWDRKRHQATVRVTPWVTPDRAGLWLSMPM